MKRNVAESDAPSYAIESVDSALRVLKILSDFKELRLSEVTEHLGVAQSTAHRILAMLIHHGFARQDEPRGKYLPGPQILKIGFAAVRSMEMRHYARPVLEELRDQVNETVHLAVPYGRHVFYVEGVESRHQLRVGLRVGEFVPAHCVGLGKVLLAALPRADFYRLFPVEDLPTLTANSIDSRTKLERQFEGIRKLGYARSRAESDEGVGSVAMALTDEKDKAQAAVSVSAPLVRFDPEKAAAAIEAIRIAKTKLQDIIWGAPTNAVATKSN